MWIVASMGFFSIVQKPADKKAGTLTVRARVRSDLDALRAAVMPGLGPSKESSSTDYRFRATAPRAEVQAAMVKLIAELDYDNFKSRVAKVQGSKREQLYHGVWSVLYKMQGDATYEAKAKKVAPLKPALPVADAYGGVLIDQHHRVLLRQPTGHYGGYVWTFAKGCPDSGETPVEAALREVLEETGYDAEIIGVLPKAYGGTTSSTSFFLMKPIGAQGKFSDETIETRWVDFDDAVSLIQMTKVATGRTRDLAVLAAARAALSAFGAGAAGK